MAPDGIFNTFRGGLDALETLQAFEEHPGLLANQRSQYYSDDPPPYSDSGSPTEPATPERYVAPVTVRSESLPKQQFRLQSMREESRIIHQVEGAYDGRKETLSFDRELDFRANAENNVRGY